MQNKVLAMRKDKSVLPVNIRVTKLNSTGESEGTFIGIMHPSSDDETGGPEGRMLVWIASDGNVVAVNKAFASVTGFGTPDIQGKPLSSVGAPNSRWDELIAEARDELGITATGAELPGMPAAEGQERLKELRKPITGKMRHKYSRENFAMSGAVRAVGTGDGAMVEVEFSTSAALDGVAVFDLQGRMMYANRALEQMLGYDEGFPDVRRMTLDKVLPPPLAQFHTPLLKAVVMSGEQPPEHVPCFRGHLVFLEGKNRAHVPARLHWWPQRQGTSMAFIVIAQPASVPDELVPWGVTSATRLQDACISLTAVTTSDGVIAGVGCGLGFTRHGIPGDVFGMDAASMRGRSLSDYIDVLQALVQNAQLYSKVEPREVLGQMMRQLCAAKRDQVLQSFRASVICASRTGSVPDYVPIRFTVEPVTGSGVSVAALSHRSEVDPALGKRIGVEGGYVVRIWSSNWINAHLMVAKDGTVRGGNHTLEVTMIAVPSSPSPSPPSPPSPPSHCLPSSRPHALHHACRCSSERRLRSSRASPCRQ